jgi:hypothetical protein
MAMARQPRPIQHLQPNKTCRCGACEPPRPRPPKGMRRLKVYYKWPSGSENTVPLIMLQGEWLRRAGFDIGDEVLVTMETNRLTIDFEKRNKG